VDAKLVGTRIDQRTGIESASFADGDWNDFDGEGTRFVECRFADAQFSGTNFAGAIFAQCQFHAAPFLARRSARGRAQRTYITFQ
jgi:uncharacterized protein YjbI with pentapeptide repeats